MIFDGVEDTDDKLATSTACRVSTQHNSLVPEVPSPPKTVDDYALNCVIQFTALFYVRVLLFDFTWVNDSGGNVKLHTRLKQRVTDDLSKVPQ